MNNNDINSLVLLKKVFLNTSYANETPSGTHVRVRCPLCGDSSKSFNSTHCYINIEGGKPLTNYCFLCNNGGFTNSTFMRSLNVTDLRAITTLNKYNSAFIKNRKYWKTNGRKILIDKDRTSVPILKRNDNLDYKINYISQRLGVQLTYEMCTKLKIVLSLKEFLDYNAIPLNPSMYNLARMLEEDYVGFLSMRGEYITFRNTKNTNNKRYVIYPIFTKNENSNKFYVIPNEVDLMAEDVDFHVAEGCFDILSCYFNINECKTDNVIYGADCGSGYLNFIKSIIRLGFVKNLNLHIYSDNTINIRYYKKIIDLKDLYKSINIYYNHYGKEKDIGVPKERLLINRVKIR